MVNPDDVRNVVGIIGDTIDPYFSSQSIDLSIYNDIYNALN